MRRRGPEAKSNERGTNGPTTKRAPEREVRRAGRQHILWDQRVNGRPLRPGRYKVTLRALAGRTRVRELSRSVDLRVR